MKTEQNLGDTGFELNCRGFFPRKNLKIQMRSNDFHLIVVMVGRWNSCMVQQRPNLVMVQIRVLVDKSTLKRFLTLWQGAVR